MCGSTTNNEIPNPPKRPNEGLAEAIPSKIVKNMIEEAVRAGREQALNQMNPRKTGLSSEYSQTKPQSRDGRPICFNCGKVGHLARVCRSKPKATRPSKLAIEPLPIKQEKRNEVEAVAELKMPSEERLN